MIKSKKWINHAATPLIAIIAGFNILFPMQNYHKIMMIYIHLPLRI